MSDVSNVLPVLNTATGTPVTLQDVTPKNTTNGPINPLTVMPKTLQDVDSLYFGPNEIGLAVQMIQHISTLKDGNGKDVPVVFNGTWAEDEQFPAGYGLYVFPIGKTVKDPKEGNVRVKEKVVAAAVPTLDSLLTTEAGRDYVEREMRSGFQTKIRNVLIRAEDIASVSLPITIEQFIERSERGAADQGLAAFKTIGPNLVKMLDKKGVTTNLQLLRQILQSTAFAQALMPKVSQKVWQKVIEVGKTNAAEKKLPTTIFDKWLETRDSIGVDVEMEDIDLS
jgi:hypothetical protein